MTAPYQKPNHHMVGAIKLREWRIATNTDKDKSICHYCDEDLAKTKRLNCSRTCGTFDVWVDTPTLARMNLEGIYV